MTTSVEKGAEDDEFSYPVNHNRLSRSIHISSTKDAQLTDPLLSSDTVKAGEDDLKKLIGASTQQDTLNRGGLRRNTLFLTEQDENVDFRITRLDLPQRERTNSETVALMPEKEKLNPYARQTMASRATMLKKTVVL